MNLFRLFEVPCSLKILFFTIPGVDPCLVNNIKVTVVSEIQEIRIYPANYQWKFCVGSKNFRKMIFFPFRRFVPVMWLAASIPRGQCRPLARYNNMAASEGDHRVQKSPAAAQRPPHLKALEVLPVVFNIVLIAFWCVSLIFGAFFTLGTKLFWEHVKTTSSSSKALNFGVFYR